MLTFKGAFHHLVCSECILLKILCLFFQRNPELNQMLSNPEVIRQSMEIASNPSLLQEMMRSYDRAVLNLESIPGGSGHLQRIYESVQEPMLNAMQGGDANNPFADLAGKDLTRLPPAAFLKFF